MILYYIKIIIEKLIQIINVVTWSGCLDHTVIQKIIKKIIFIARIDSVCFLFLFVMSTFKLHL